MSSLEATPGAKMIYLIKRRPGTAREELVAHWFANHMPLVIEAQAQQAEAGRMHASRYVATLFDALPDGSHPWDGVAQLTWPRALRNPAEPHGTEPTDTFQQKAEPYLGWATTEYVVIDADETLGTAPLTLNAPYPTTRSGFFKVTFLVAAKPDIDFDAFYTHWLDVHAVNVADTLAGSGGFGYVISHSQQPEDSQSHTPYAPYAPYVPYAGMAELYFEDADGWRAYKGAIKEDGMQNWASDTGTLVLRSHVEMVGIP